MQLWLIPFLYAVASIAGSFILPRLEARYFAHDLDLSISSAQAYLSAVASGMMALTGIVFSIAAEVTKRWRVEDRQELGLSHRQED